MNLALMLLVALSLLELLIWLPGIWRGRKVLGTVVVTGLAVGSSALVSVHPRVWTVFLAIFSIYRIFNLLRMVEGRLQADYLQRVTRHSSQELIGLQVLLVAVVVLSRYTMIGDESRWLIVAILQLLVGLMLLLSTRQHLRTTRTLAPTKSYADRDLPSLSVMIPARNETEDLENCLQALIASDYPKLEILVLDDCSQNSRTSEIIRSFAHSGVRFIAGKEPADNWLAKNFAYEQLAESASGDLLLFCGVDVSFEPNALRTLVSTLLEKDKSMLSVLPHNAPPHDYATYLLQPARYAWELSLPRRLFNRPAVLSTCWLIKRSLLKSTGSFKAASRSITPESHFARNARVHDGYSFVRSDLVVSNKPFSAQRDTTIRTRYPQLRRRPELVSLVSLAEITFLVAPFAVFIVAMIQKHWLTALLSGLACACLITFYSLVVAVTYRRFKLWNLLLIPFVGLYDVGLLNYSMYKYEFSEVLWKGRNICLPVMRTIAAAETE